MRISRRYGWLVLITLVVIVLAFLFPAIAVQVFVNPVSRVVWLVLRGFLAIDQEIYWGALILAVIILALRVAPIQREKYHSSAYGDLPAPEDRLSYWDRLIHSAENNGEARTTLERQMEELRSSLEPACDEKERNNFHLPPAKTGIRHNIQNTWNQAVHRWNLVKGKPACTEFENDFTSIIEKIESSLEIQNGKQDT